MQGGVSSQGGGPFEAGAACCVGPRSEAGALASVPAGSWQPGRCVDQFPLFSPQPARLLQAGVGAQSGPRAGGPMVRPVIHRSHPPHAQALFPERRHSLIRTRVLFSKQEDCTCMCSGKAGAPASHGPGSCWRDPAGIVPHCFIVFLAASN